jgi:hypothetical protein
MNIELFGQSKMKEKTRRAWVAVMASMAMLFCLGCPAPTLTSLTPDSVSEAEPTFTLTVNGAGFRTGAQVYWNGSARRTTFVSRFQLQALIPTCDVLTPGTAGVTATASSPQSNALTFTIVADNSPPVVTQLLPASGSTLGNSRVTILGDHFKPELVTASALSRTAKSGDGTVRTAASGTGIFFGGVQATDVVFVNRKQLEVTTPANAAGSTEVTVAQSTGTAMLPNAYTYKTLPPVQLSADPAKKRLQIAFVVDSPQFRSNLGINLGESEATVDVHLVDNNGLLVAKKTGYKVAAHGMNQIDHVIRDLEVTGGMTGQEGTLILQSAQEIAAWATQIDNVSLDPSIELGSAEADAAIRVLLPSSVSNNKFLTNLIVINSSDSAGTINITSRDGQGNVQASLMNQAIAARGYLVYRDFYQTVGLSNVSGPIEVEAGSGIKVVAAERIYTRESCYGTSSAYFEGVEWSRASQTVILPDAVDTAEFRTNLGMNNEGSNVATVQVDLIGNDGAVLGSLMTTVAPHGLTQINNINRRLMGQDETTITDSEGSLWLRADQAIIAWTSQIDNNTQDPSLAVGRTSTASKILIPSTTSLGSFHSTLVVVNLANASTSVQITARDKDGNVQGTPNTVSIPGQGRLVNYGDIRDTPGLAGTFGPLEILSTGNKPLLAVSRVQSTQGTGGYFEGMPAETSP